MNKKPVCRQDWDFSSYEFTTGRLCKADNYFFMLPSFFLHQHTVKNSFIFIVQSACRSSIHDTFTNSLPWYAHHAAVVPIEAPHALPMSPCSTHLLNRRPPACMWLWTVCQRPALLPPVTMLRMLSLRLGPAPVPEQAPPPLSLVPGEGPAPPCPPLSTAPLAGMEGNRRQRNTDGREERIKRGYKKWRIDERQTHKRTGPESKSDISKVSLTGE